MLAGVNLIVSWSPKWPLPLHSTVITSFPKVISTSVMLVNHRQRGSDCTMSTATGLVNGEEEILTPYRIETLKPIDKKFGTRGCVRETTFYAKSGANPSTGGGWGGFWASRCNITLLTLIIHLVPIKRVPLNSWRNFVKSQPIFKIH